MRFLIAVLFAQLLGCNALGGLPPSPPNRAIDCDDPEAEAAATAAVEYINKHHLHGYKFRLNRIEEVKVISKKPTGELFVLELDLLETKCHVLSPTPVENCEVRPVAEHAVEGDCDVKVLKADGIFSVVSTRCKSKPDSAEDVADVCPKCPLLAALNDTRVVQGVEALVKYVNSQDNLHFHQLYEIGRARIWTVPENAVELEFVTVTSNCTIQEVEDATANCVPQYKFCVGTAKTNATVEDNVVICTAFQPQIAASAPSTGQQQTVVIPPVVVYGHGHHHLPQVHPDSSSGESSSSEQVAPSVAIPTAAATDAGTAAPIAANVIVKRSLAEEPVPPAAVPVLPVCPGRIRFFE